MVMTGGWLVIVLPTLWALEQKKTSRSWFVMTSGYRTQKKTGTPCLRGTSVFSYMEVSWNRGPPKSSILIGFSIINHQFWIPPFMETPICSCIFHHYVAIPFGKCPFSAATGYNMIWTKAQLGSMDFMFSTSGGHPVVTWLIGHANNWGVSHLQHGGFHTGTYKNGRCQMDNPI